MLNKGTTGTIFITSLVWRGPCLGGLNPGPPALEASTLPLGYRGGGIKYRVIHLKFKRKHYIYQTTNRQTDKHPVQDTIQTYVIP